MSHDEGKGRIVVEVFRRNLDQVQVTYFIVFMAQVFGEGRSGIIVHRPTTFLNHDKVLIARPE